jgi:hypothetical protein
MEQKTEVALDDKMREDLKEKMQRLTALQEQRVLQETILKNLTREIHGLEAVVGYIRGKLK